MSDLKINLDLLNKFENELNPGFTKKNTIPTKVLGYGEISTVLEIGSGDDRALAYKRMPMFKTEQEAKDYEILYKEYIKILNDRIGLQIVAGDITTLVNEEKGRMVGYIAQRKLPSTTIGHKAIHYLSKENITRLILAALRETRKVFEFNTQNKGNWSSVLMVKSPIGRLSVLTRNSQILIKKSNCFTWTPARRLCARMVKSN